MDRSQSPPPRKTKMACLRGVGIPAAEQFVAIERSGVRDIPCDAGHRRSDGQQRIAVAHKIDVDNSADAIFDHNVLCVQIVKKRRRSDGEEVRFQLGAQRTEPAPPSSDERSIVNL